MNTVGDKLYDEEDHMMITSGSFGEGLELRGSDIDLMFVLKRFMVHEHITYVPFNATKSYFTLMTDDKKPGYAMLRLNKSHNPFVLNICEQFRGNTYLSNILLKQSFLTRSTSVIHGPCVSDIRGNFDYAICLPGNVWTKPASHWIFRSNNSWPNEKTMIINHGMLFVPIGVKESPLEDLEWRISFSVGENFSSILLVIRSSSVMPL